LLVLLPVVLLVGCSSSSTDQHRSPPAERFGAPIIRESFTPLACPADPAARQTTLGAEGCTEARILRTDAALNRRIETIFHLLPDRTAKAKFISAESAWLVYRKKACTNVADKYRGGSAQPVLFADCVVARNRAHLGELRALERLAGRR
jgi:uncharacterized protein YecT (DUF1311 family)